MLSKLSEVLYLRSYINSAVLIVAAAFGGCAVLRRVGNEQLLKAILALLTMSCIAVLLSSVLADFFLITPETAANRQHGTFRGPNQAGLVGCMTVVSALSFLCAGQHRKLACLSLILGVGAIIGSNSRTAMLIVILTFAFFAIISRRGRRSIARLLFVMILIGVAALMTTDLKRVVPEILGPAQLARLEAIQCLLRGQEVYDYSINERLYLLGSALHQVAESPVVGHGLGQFHELRRAPYNAMGRRQQGAHNQYLTFVGEAGIIPLVLYVLSLNSLLQVWWRMSRTVAAYTVIGWTLAIVIYGLFSHWVLLSRWLNLLLGLSCALVAVQRNAQA